MSYGNTLWNRLRLFSTVVIAVAGAATATLSGAKTDRGPVQAVNKGVTGNVWLIFELDDPYDDISIISGGSDRLVLTAPVPPQSATGDECMHVAVNGVDLNYETAGEGLSSAIPKAYLWVVPNGGHGPVFGDAALRFAETALSFLRGEWG